MTAGSSPPLENHGERMTRIRLVIAGAIAAGVLAMLGWVSVRGGIEPWIESLGRMGPWGPVVLAAAYVPACVLMLPGWPLSLGAGFLFGVLPGTVAVSVGSTVGAATAFAIARYALRNELRERMQRNVRIRALDRVISERGPQVVFLARLSPVLPFNLLNYALGLTSVPGLAYVGATWLGMLPATVLYVHVGAAARDLAEALRGQTRDGVGGLPLLGVGLAATAILLVLLVRGARRNLVELLREEAGSSAGEREPTRARLGEEGEKP